MAELFENHYQQGKPIFLPKDEDLLRRVTHIRYLNEQKVTLNANRLKTLQKKDVSAEAFFEFVLLQFLNHLLFGNELGNEDRVLETDEAEKIISESFTSFPQEHKLQYTRRAYDAYNTLYEMCQVGSGFDLLKYQRQAFV